MSITGQRRTRMSHERTALGAIRVARNGTSLAESHRFARGERGLFAAAFASMTSLPSWVRRDRGIVRNLPVLVGIPTPARRPTPVAPKTTPAPNHAASPPNRPHVPPSDKVAPVAPSPVDSGLASPAEPTTARDSGAELIELRCQKISPVDKQRRCSQRCADRTGGCYLRPPSREYS